MNKNGTGATNSSAEQEPSTRRLGLAQPVSSSVWLCLVLLTINVFFQFDYIHNQMDPLIVQVLFLLFVVLFLIISIGTLIKAMKDVGKPLFFRYKYVLMNLVTLLLVLPLQALASDWSFRLCLPERIAVVKTVTTLPTLSSHESDYELADKWKYLSMGGRVTIYSDLPDKKTNGVHVRFYRNPDFGFEFSGDNKPPKNASSTFLQENWYSFYM